MRGSTRSPWSVRTFCSLLLPPDAGGPDPEVVTAAALDYLDHLLPESRALSRAGFRLVAGLAAVTARRSPAGLAPEESEPALERVAGLHPELRTTVDALKAVALLAHGADAHAAEIRATGRAHEPVMADPPLHLTPSADWPSASRCDVVVVGSGAGGAMVARRLARAGLDVVVVEEGRRWGVDEIRDTHPMHRYARMYRDGGATVALGSPSVMLPLGRAVGGTTVVNSGTCYRPPVDVLKRWTVEMGLHLAEPDRLAPHLDDVERLLGVAPTPLEVMGLNGRMAMEGAAALGWRHGPLRRNAPGCKGSCQCAIGCPNNAKAGVHLTALPEACADGARILTNARVVRVVHRGWRADGVIVRRPDGTRLEIAADAVVVAAGAIGTPDLLARSGMDRHPWVGRNLAVHPALGAAGRFEERIVPWHGVLQSAGIEELHQRRGILIEATSTPPGMGSLVLPGYGPELVRRVAEADHLVTLGAMIGDKGSGRVMRIGGRSVMRYDLDPDDGRRLLESVAAMGRVLFAAGAVEVFTGLPHAPVVADQGELDDAVAGADVRRVHLAAFHPTGTAAAGGDSQRHPVDPRGRLRGWDGMWVADASVLPTCPEVNPQVSIMAVADAIAGELLVT